MEIKETTEDRFLDPEGKPLRITDHKLFYPEDFQSIHRPHLMFKTDENYMQPEFILDNISMQLIRGLAGQAKRNRDREWGKVIVNNQGEYFINRNYLSGKFGIGFQVLPNMLISDYFHTHTILENEKEEDFALFSSDDVLSLGSKGAKRYWLVGEKHTWTLINLYGQQYYYAVKEACKKLERLYSPHQNYQTRLNNLIECVNKCNFRLYEKVDSNKFELRS